jgi:polysaccharide biosynthesis PFTS motif protein
VKIPLLSNLINSIRYKKIRAMIHGYRLLKTSGNLGLIRSVKREFAAASFNKIKETASLLYFGAGWENAELIVRQYLLTRNGGIGLNKALLYVIGSKNKLVVYPLPKELQTILVNNGFGVSAWLCTVLWVFQIGIFWCYGMLLIAKNFFFSIKSICHRDSNFKKQGIYFIGLNKTHLPQPSLDGYDLITWYANWLSPANGINNIFHDVRNVKSTVASGKTVEYVANIIPQISSIEGLAKFIAWSLLSASLAAFDFFRGRWWTGLMLAEAVKAAGVRYSGSHISASEYLFQNSITFYRPMWTYEVEKSGSKIISYFYSTSEEFKLPSGYEPSSTYWELMNWPMYLVWDKFQEEQIKRNICDSANVKVVGPIWFVSSPLDLPVIPRDSVAVFDVQPVRISSHFPFSTMADLHYGNPMVHKRFLEDVYSALISCNFTLVHKLKRKNTGTTVKSYSHLVARLSKLENFVSIEPETSPVKVIEKCQAVISIPFTSTAIIGRNLGKPSIYYDPIGVIQKDDRGSHDIPIINTQEELKVWLMSVLRKPP